MYRRCFTPDALFEKFKNLVKSFNFKPFESMNKESDIHASHENLAIVNCFDQPIKRLWRCISSFIFSLGEEDANWILQVFIYMFSSDGRTGFW
jgi:hypothetical protein